MSYLSPVSRLDVEFDGKHGLVPSGLYIVLYQKTKTVGRRTSSMLVAVLTTWPLAVPYAYNTVTDIDILLPSPPTLSPFLLLSLALPFLPPP